MHSAMNFEQARFNMIEQQIRPWDVLDAHVLQLLSVVKREDFVPAPHKALAFVDMEIPLPGGQCMLAPRVEARMLQDLAVQKHEKVLEIGAGSGYMAALLAHRAQRVISLEIRRRTGRAGQREPATGRYPQCRGAPAGRRWRGTGRRAIRRDRAQRFHRRRCRSICSNTSRSAAGSAPSSATSP